jgi:ribosomal RNA-processing protein 9
VNGLAFAPSGRFLLVGVGQEHRLGRWDRQRAAKNSIRVVPIRFSKAGAATEDPVGPVVGGFSLF